MKNTAAISSCSGKKKWPGGPFSVDAPCWSNPAVPNSKSLKVTEGTRVLAGSYKISNSHEFLPRIESYNMSWCYPKTLVASFKHTPSKFLRPYMGQNPGALPGFHSNLGCSQMWIPRQPMDRSKTYRKLIQDLHTPSKSGRWHVDQENLRNSCSLEFRLIDCKNLNVNE